MTDQLDRRREPEIIPPGAPLPRGSTVWMSGDAGGAHYVRVTRLGPVGATLLMLGVAAVAALGLLFLLGAAIVGLAAVGVLTLIGIIAGILRGPPRPLR